MTTLFEIEKIKQLKARYFRALDTNDWALFSATLAENCTAEYSDGDLCFESRDGIVHFMRENLSGDRILTMHHGHHPEIEIIDDNTATGIWYLEDTVLALDVGMRIYGAAIYSDQYRKEGGDWVISHTGYRRTFECAEPLDKTHSVVKNMFVKNG